MSRLSRQDVLKLARLSRLRLSDEEISSFQVQLSALLAYVETLDRADTGGLEPTWQVTGLENVTRPDNPADYQAKPDDILKNAPHLEGRHFKVKRVLD